MMTSGKIILFAVPRDRHEPELASGPCDRGLVSHKIDDTSAMHHWCSISSLPSHPSLPVYLDLLRACSPKHQSSISFSAALHCMLVGGQLLSSSADECIAMLADFDPEEAQRLRQVLAVHHGDGNELMLSVGSILGTPEATLVTDATKEGIVCRKVRQYLVEDRRPYLEAVKEGFWALNLADHLEHFCGAELATLFFGEQYVDVDRLIDSLCMEQGEEIQTTQDWLHRFVKALSEHSIRVFLACVTNRLSLSTAGQTITVEVCSKPQQPRFYPVASHMQLPACASYDVFASRMNAALRLGEYMMRTDAQHEQRLTREEERAVAQAMDGEIRPGGYYKCGCGYIYAIGECGGPMQQATCPGCGSNIGGAQHRLAGGNAPAGFDGARAPAWPQ